MSYAAFISAAIVFTFAAHAHVKLEPVEYKDGDTTLKGFIAYDADSKEKRPGVVVVPEWWGVNDYVKGRAKQLAELGYVAFVADMYGEGFVTADPKVAGEKSGEQKKANSLARRGALAADQLKKSDRVDAEKIAAIGYCFGGTAVLDMARAGQDVKGVVSFHGGLSTDHPAEQGKVKARVLVLTGDADSLVPPEQVAAFSEEMTKANAPATIVHYPNAKHSFTNPNADKVGLPPIGYNREADEQSWKQMKLFFKEIFGAAPAGGATK